MPRIAIINTEDDGEPSIGISEQAHLTAKLREVANNILPKNRYGIMTQQSIVDRLGSQERAAKECREATCLADLGRKVNADYIAQARIGRFEGNLTIKVELYQVGNSNLIASFTGDSKKARGLLSILEEKAPAMFMSIMDASSDTVSSVDWDNYSNYSNESTQNTTDQGSNYSSDYSSNDYSSNYSYQPATNNAAKPYRRPYDNSYNSSSYNSYWVPEYVEFGWQKIGGMHHLRCSFSLFYTTFGYKSFGTDEYGYEDEAMEIVAGAIVRWNTRFADSFTIGFGLFGGLGWLSAYETEKTKYELGIEFILGYFSLYIAERSSQVGGGIGLIFQPKQ